MTDQDWFPARINFEEHKWTREKATKIRVSTDAGPQELVVSAEPCEEERDLQRIAQALSIDCLLTPHEKYWACRYTGLLPLHRRDKLFYDKFRGFSGSAGDFSRPLREIRVSSDRSGIPLFLEKKDGYEMVKIAVYMNPLVGLRDASRSSASMDQIEKLFDGWSVSLLQRFRQFHQSLDSDELSKMSIWKTWTNDEIATAFVVSSILRPASANELIRQYLRVWDGILRASSIDGLIYLEARSGENVLMMERKNKEPFTLGFRDSLWTRVRLAESFNYPGYDPYHRTEGAGSRVESSETFRPFYWGKQSGPDQPSCRPGAPGETLVNTSRLVDFSLMLIHLRLLELRNRITDKFRSRVLQDGNRVLCCKTTPSRNFSEWATSLAPCLAKQLGRLIEETNAAPQYKQLPERLAWELNEALKVVTQLYRANGWSKTATVGLIDTHPFDRLNIRQKHEHVQRVKIDEELKSDRLSCSVIVARKECPFLSEVDPDKRGISLVNDCVSACKKKTHGGDIEDLASQLTATFPLTGDWNPWIASTLSTINKAAEEKIKEPLLRLETE